MRRADALMWFGLFGAPFAWAAQHVTGVLLSIATCHDNTDGPDWHPPFDAIAGIVTAVAAAIAVLGLLSALAAWLGARDADDSDPPPAGRVHFLAVVGLTISPLFIAIILMSGIGSTSMQLCVQS